MKKKILLPVLLVLLIGLGGYLLWPRYVIANPDDATIHNVDYRQSGGAATDLTDAIDARQLVALLSTYRRGPVPHSFSPYPTDAVVYEIDGMAGGKPVHILLGDVNVVYESGGLGGYEIRDSAALIAALDALRLGS